MRDIAATLSKSIPPSTLTTLMRTRAGRARRAETFEVCAFIFWLSEVDASYEAIE